MPELPNLGPQAVVDPEADPMSVRRTLVHWGSVDARPTSLHGNGAASLGNTSLDWNQVTCTLCRSLRPQAPVEMPSPPRVVFSLGQLASAVTARRRHRCDGHLALDRHDIEPGEKYVRAALPPHSELGNETWWSSKLCLDCAPAAYDDREPAPQTR